MINDHDWYSRGLKFLDIKNADLLVCRKAPAWPARRTQKHQV